MPQKARSLNASRGAALKRPVQDIKAAKAAGQFPAVGMTLRSYQYDPKDRSRRAPGRPPVVKKGRWQRFKRASKLKKAVIILSVLVLLMVAFVAGKFLYNAQRLFGGNILGIFQSTKLRGEDEGRVNILLAGNSADDVGHSGGRLTDSIMLISIDTRQHKAVMLSLPRDLWVEVPNYGHQKINRVYVTGEDDDFKKDGYPDGGMGLLEQVVSENLGIPIHYYALVNYNALRQSVNAVGGIDITVKSSDPRGLYDPNIDWTTHGPLVRLSNGRHHLNGQEALDLARARGDAYNSYGFAESDFARTEHQRQILAAIKDKAVSVGTLSNPAKLSSLADSIGGNVETDFEINEVRRLYELIKGIGGNSLQSLSLNKADGKNLLTSYAAPGGQSALIPAAGLDNFSEIKSFLKRKMSADPVAQEAARLVVLNGTMINGLAAKMERRLTANNFVVEEVGDAGNIAQVNTAIIDATGGKKPATSTALAKFFGSKHKTTQNPYANVYDADFIIVLGSDQASKSTTRTTN